MVYGEHSGTIRVIVSYSIKYVQSCSVVEAKCWSKNTEYCLLLPGQRKGLWLGKTIGTRVCRAWVDYKIGSHHVHDGVRGQEKNFIWRCFFPDGPNSMNLKPISQPPRSLPNRHADFSGCLFTQVPLSDCDHSYPQDIYCGGTIYPNNIHSFNQNPKPHTDVEVFSTL